MRAYGTVVFAEEVTGTVFGLELRHGRITLLARIPQPHPRVDVSTWALYGDDRELIYQVLPTDDRDPCIIEALDAGGTTTAYLPLAVLDDEGRVRGARDPHLRLPTDGTVEYRP